MRQFTHEIEAKTRGKGLYPVTRQAVEWVEICGVSKGLLTLFLRHTSASLLVQENADPDVLRDLETFLSRLVPEDPRLYRHNEEGPDDMPAHIRAALTQVQIAIPVIGGRLALGTWQGIFVFEHRTAPHRRTIAVHLIGE